jgi:N-acetylneuraminic acid mutarotase
MKRIALLVSAALVMSCRDGGTGPDPLGPPILLQVNGVTEPVGLVGMTVLLEGTSLGDAARGSVYFAAPGGGRVEATVVDAEWTSTFVITTVPVGVADSSFVWIETTGGVSDSIPFTLINSGTFSPSNIAWTATTSLPQPLQGLGALALKVTHGTAQGSYVFATGGVDQANTPVNAVYRANVQAGGTLGTWDPLGNLPEARAYHAFASATPSTARVDTTVGGYLYVVGGLDGAGAASTSVYVAEVGLDGGVGAWQTTTALPAAVHNAGAVVFRGYLYLVGGADAQHAATTTALRAEVQDDGTLGAWESLPALPAPRAYHAFVSFGPYLYVVGGDAGTVSPESNALSGDETNGAYFARIDMKDGTIAGWTSVANMSKARGKHSAVVAGGSVLATSGIYSGQVGSSENMYATIGTDGTLAAWNGATGANTIGVVLGYGVYNAAAVTLIDAQGQGHVLVIGGAQRSPGALPSAGVVYY